MASKGIYSSVLYWTLTFLSCPTMAPAQDLSSTPVPVDLGVSTQVNTMFQDEIGFIWLGTNSGLYRYDGYSCVSYSHVFGDSSSIGSNAIYALCKDRTGTLWVGTGLGLEKPDGISGRFRHFRPNPRATESSDSNSVRSICEDRDGTLWVGTLSGLHRFDRATEKFTRVPLSDVEPIDSRYRAVLAIYADKEGALWFGTNVGLVHFDFTSGKFTRRPYEEAYEVNSILKDEAGVLWLGTNAGLKAYNSKEWSCATYQYTPEEGRNVFVLSNEILSVFPSPRPGFLWVMTAHGGLTFDKGSKTFVPWNVEASNICLERSGTLLLATRTGVKKFLQTKSPFRQYPVGRTPVTVVSVRKGVLWAFGSGWHKFDIKAGRSVPYSYGSEQLFYVFPRFHGAHMAFLKGDGSFCIRDSLGKETLHLDTRWEGVYRSLSHSYRTHKGYYLGTQDGRLYLLEPRTNGVSQLLNLKQWICWIQEDRSGFLWVATLQGRLIRFDQVKGTFTEFDADRRNPSSWRGSNVNWLYEDSGGRMWIATSDGLEKYDPDSNVFTHYTEESGLLGNNVRGVWGDDHGYLWISSTKGISRLDPQTGVFRNYDASYGFSPPAGGFYGGVVKAENGEIFMGGHAGIIRFHPDSLRENLFVPPVVITSFRIFDKSTPITNNIILPHDKNFISFEFAALNYVMPERNQYAYRMNGIDRDWVYPGTRRYASYPNLPPGDYVFHVKGSNNEGIWNETGTSLAFVIEPPWWNSHLAFVLYGLAIVGTLYATRKLQMRRIKIRHAYEMSKFEAEKLHEVDELKSRFFTNISHEFRTPLTLILGPVKELADELEDPKTRQTLTVIHRNAAKLLNLVNELLDLSKLESGSMKLQASLQNVVSLLKVLLQSFYSYAERKTIDLKFQPRDEEILAYVDRDKFERIFINILSNAFKFTPDGGRIDVSVVKADEHVNVRVSDTGIGIPRDKLPLIFDRFYQVESTRTREQGGSGIGLSLSKELVELHKGKIEVESEEGRGTTFIVRFPLGKGHLKPEEIADGEVEGNITGSTEAKTEIVEAEAEPVQIGPKPDTVAEREQPLVLIVDDNADVRAYVRSNLTNSWRILEAKDGKEGWSLSIEKLPDLIVSDVKMPEMNGFQLCQKLKSDERTSHIPVILLTAKATGQDKIEGFETGADAYIIKPFEPAELRARMKNLLEQRKRLHDHFRKHGLFQVEDEKITPVDQRFLEKVFATVQEHISDVAFGVEPLADCLAVSRSLLLKKLEALTGEPPIALIRRIRLDKAARLIEGGFGNISEVALEVGFANPSYFTECFKKQFGVGPKDYRSSLIPPPKRI